MEKTDVVVMVDADGLGRASESVQSLRKYLKTEVGDWFLFCPKSDRGERLAYDLGFHLVHAPADPLVWGQTLVKTGTSPRLLLWSADSALLSDWHPWVSSKAKTWKKLTAALVLRQELNAWGQPCAVGSRTEVWSARLALHDDTEWLADNQVSEADSEEFARQISEGFHLPFAPKAVVLKKKK